MNLLKKIFGLIIVFTFFLSFRSDASASMRITSLSTNSVKGGETLAIYGSDLKLEGSESCTYYPSGSKTIVWSTCKFKTQVFAMKKEPASGCPRPLFYFPVISVNSTEAVVKVPTEIQDGEGQWYVSWGGTYDNGDEFMIGGGELPLTITGVKKSEYKCVQKDGTIIGEVEPSITPTSIPSPTITISPAKSPTPLATEKKDDISDSRFFYGLISFILNVIKVPYNLFIKLLHTVG